MQPKRKVKISTPAETAAGLKSIQTVAYRIWEETHIGKGVKTLFKLNQPEGLDCPSCAWPDPDAKDVSKIAEYCENGAKAIAWESSVNKIEASFFQQHSINDLLEKSDHWLEKQGRLTQPMVILIKPYSTLPVAPAMKRHFCTSVLSDNLAPITFLIVPICAMKHPERH